MANFLTSFFQKKSESVLGIDIGASAIKVVQLHKKGGKAILDTYGEIALGPYANLEVGRATSLGVDKTSEALTDVLRESNTATKKCGMAIPFGSSLMTIMEMPALPQKQLAQMIPIEARKYIPVPISEVLLDWWVIPKPENRFFGADDEQMTGGQKPEKIDILAVAIHNDTITKYQEIIERSGLDASFFEIEIFSTIRSILEQDIAPVAVIDMGAALTKLYIVERGVVKSSHTINRGSQDITIAISRAFSIDMAAAEVLKRTYGLPTAPKDKDIGEMVALSLDYVFSEANRILMNYQKKFNRTISKIMCVGGGVKVHQFLALAKTHFTTEVFLGDPFSKIEAPAFLEELLKTTGPEFAVAVGIGLRKLHEFE